MSKALLIIVVAGVASILLYHFKTGAPPVPSTPAEVASVVALLRRAGIGSHSKIYELGCGWGSLVIGLAHAFPEASIVGVEISPLPYLVARFRARRKDRIDIMRGDYRLQPMRDADAVTAYLGIKQMESLAPVLDRSVRPGTPIVTLCFAFRDRT